jgi:hypothetical protein
VAGTEPFTPFIQLSENKKMRRLRNSLAVFSAVFVLVVSAAGIASAQNRNERQVRDTVRSLASRIDDFQLGLQNELRARPNRQDAADTMSSLRNLQDKVTAFQDNLDARRENRDDVREIVTAARDIDAFLSQNQQSRALETDWQGVRDLINRLASNYGVTPDWSRRTSNYPDQRPAYPTDPAPRMSTQTNYNTGLTGTYQLDRGRSENTADIVSGTRVGDANRQDLESKLEAPQQVALDVRANQVTLATTNASPITFTADGREKTEQSGGRTVRLKATLRGQGLTVTSLGGDTDYTITFSSSDNGRTLKVTRRITTNYLSETVFAESVYNKTDQVARLGIQPGGPVTPVDDSTYSTNDPNDRTTSNGPAPSIAPGRTGEFIVPNGSLVTGVLESTIDTKVSQNGDRFRLTVQSPDEYRGATIEGYISGVGRSGEVSGRSNVTFNFESITLRSGERYDFAGYLQSIKDQNGKPVRVDSEGVAKGDSQTRETAKRGGIGAGLGAVIGAIAGGGKGAAIGAIIGGGAGAGSVIAQGRDDVQLFKGSMITVQSSSPIRRDQPQFDN